MVLETSSRSARTALPREQNQPGRRLEHDAQPSGDWRPMLFCRRVAGGIAKSAIFLPSIQSAHPAARWM